VRLNEERLEERQAYVLLQRSREWLPSFPEKETRRCTLQKCSIYVSGSELSA